ncbi:MepB family protein [Streptomyces sp. NPDC059929]
MSRSGLDCSLPAAEPGSAGYAAHAFTLDGRSVRFRVAGTTPAKADGSSPRGSGPERRRARSSHSTRTAKRASSSSAAVTGAFVQRVCPCAVLSEGGIVSCNGSGGKRRFRVHPPWAVTTSRRSRTTPGWRESCFVHLGHGPPDLARALPSCHP